MRREDAETTALRVLGWLAADEDMLRHFCGATGSNPRDLALAAEDPEFLAGVLDFLILDDAWVAGFSTAAGVTPEAVLRARSALPGGATPHWT